MTKQEQLRQKIAELEAKRITLDDAILIDAVDARLRSLREELTPHQPTITTKDVDGSINTGTMEVGGNYMGGDSITNQVTVVTEQTATAILQGLLPNQPSTDVTEATTTYLTYLVNEYRHLAMKGMGVDDRVPLRLPLLDIYVPLQGRIELPHGETWARELQVAGRPPSEEELEGMGQRLSAPQSVLKLVQENAGLVIVGDPGAGKTTFLKYLTLQLALNQDVGLGQRLPILLPLSAYANELAKREIALPDFIPLYYQRLLGKKSLPIETLLDVALEQGQALLLLDGLDEVKERTQRDLVVKRVTAFFALQKERGNKVVLTSRIVGYREVRPVADGLAECTLADFEAEEITQFVNQWTTAIERAAHGETETARRAATVEREALLEALQHNRGVRRLAANPLLLTILAVMKRQGVVLPERRVQLYEKYVQALLSHWNVARSLDRGPERDLDPIETIRVLAPLALWMHETSPGVGLVKEQALRRKLVAIYKERGWEQPEPAAKQFLADVRDHAGLLVARGERMFGFIHLTFQEYLAAVAIALKDQGTLQPVVDILAERLNDESWHEVILLTIGYLGIVQQRDEAAGAVLTTLVGQGAKSNGQAEIIAGEAVVDAWPGGVTRQCRNEIQTALLTAMRADERVEPVQRAKAGQVLAKVGDPRPFVLNVDEIRFCYVPAGSFWMGSDNHRDNEKPQHWCEVNHDYWLGQFPVTQSQYDQFIAEDGYRTPSYWAEAQQAGYWHPEKGFRERFTNFDWGEQKRLPNHPAVGVSWYEALAYTRWLTERWQGWLPNGWQVRLPTEAEWEKAAQGGVQLPRSALVRPIQTLAQSLPNLAMQDNLDSQTVYIWGNEPDPNKANYEDSGIGSTNALGCFPAGLSPYECEELAGNVFEWLQSKNKKHPYDPDDGREIVDASNNGRILRGGYYNSSKSWLRCACRHYRLPPRIVNLNTGFRVCVSGDV